MKHTAAQELVVVLSLTQWGSLWKHRPLTNISVITFINEINTGLRAAAAEVEMLCYSLILVLRFQSCWINFSSQKVLIAQREMQLEWKLTQSFNEVRPEKEINPKQTQIV